MQVSRVLIDNSKNVFGSTDSQRKDGASYVGVITFTMEGALAAASAGLARKWLYMARAPRRMLAIIQPSQCFACPTLLSRVPKLRLYSSGWRPMSFITLSPK